jgi:hypothetical protein
VKRKRAKRRVAQPPSAGKPQDTAARRLCYQASVPSSRLLSVSVVSIRAKQSQFASDRPGRVPAGRGVIAAAAGASVPNKANFPQSVIKSKHFLEKEL